MIWHVDVSHTALNNRKHSEDKNESKTGQNQFGEYRKVIVVQWSCWRYLLQQIQNTNNVKDKIERRKHGSYCWSDIPNDKRGNFIDLCVRYRLPTSKKILLLQAFLKIFRVHDLHQIKKMLSVVKLIIKVEGDLRREVNLNIKRLMEIGLPWYPSMVVDFQFVDKTLKTMLALVKVKLLRLQVKRRTKNEIQDRCA